MDLPGIIRLSTQEARDIKDQLLAHRDNLDTRYRTRIEFGANPDGREMLDIQDQKRKVAQSLKIINQRLQDEELAVKIYEQSRKSWRKTRSSKRIKEAIYLNRDDRSCKLGRTP